MVKQLVSLKEASSGQTTWQKYKLKPVSSQLHINPGIQEDLIFLSRWLRWGWMTEEQFQSPKRLCALIRTLYILANGKKKRLPSSHNCACRIYTSLWNYTTLWETKDSRSLRFFSACKEWCQLAFLLLIKTLLSASKSLYLPCALKTEPPDAAFPGHPIGYYHITSLHFLHKVAAPTSPSVYLFTTCSPTRMQAPCGACSPNIPSTKTVSIQ